MNISNYLEKGKNIQKSLLEFINNENDTEEYFHNFINIIKDQKIQDNQHEFRALLHLIINISNNHFRSPGFIKKIERILFIFKEKIKQTFSNSEIFHIFKNNKRLLLFMFAEKIISPDKSIADIMFQAKYQKANYLFYFYIEISPFIDQSFQKENQQMIEKIITNDYNEFKRKREVGENDSYICELIRKDSIDEFISYVNQKCISPSTDIDPSIFETNSFLIKKESTLIQYAAFFGSSQIFKYLYLNGARFSPSLWNFAIHGNNPELISIFEENNIHLSEQSYLFKNESYIICLIEAIKCHHFEIANYIINNCIENLSEDDSNVFTKSLKYYNYFYFPNELNNNEYFYYLCKFDYFYLVKILLKSTKIDVNRLIIIQ